jgi:hypothetical protein
MAIEERSFVTNGATLDEGQGRFWGLDLAGEEEGELGAGRKDWEPADRKDKMALYC